MDQGTQSFTRSASSSRVLDDRQQVPIGVTEPEDLRTVGSAPDAARIVLETGEALRRYSPAFAVLGDLVQILHREPDHGVLGRLGGGHRREAKLPSAHLVDVGAVGLAFQLQTE